MAGGLSQVRIPARSLRSLVPPDASLPPPAPGTGGAPHLRMRRCGPGDAAGVLATVGRVHQALRDCGPNTRDEAAVARWLSDEQRFAYLAPDGFLAYRWQHGNDELQVERVIAGSAAATRAIWGIVSSHSSIASTVHATVGPADPVQWLTTDPDVSLAGRTAWMLRVVDAAAAVAGRGFPPGVELTAVLRLADPDRPAHDGWWTLDVGGSKGVLTPAEPGPADPPRAHTALALGPRGFAALYGGTPLGTLRRAGLVAGGDPGGDAALDAAFGADPFMLEFFDPARGVPGTVFVTCLDTVGARTMGHTFPSCHCQYPCLTVCPGRPLFNGHLVMRQPRIARPPADTQRGAAGSCRQSAGELPSARSFGGELSHSPGKGSCPMKKVRYALGVAGIAPALGMMIPTAA